MILWRKQPHHAARVRDFNPKRLVGWLQDELQRFNDEQADKVEQARAEGQRVADWHAFTLHDFRRTAITGMQMAGVSEKEASIMVGCTPEVMRRHYEKLDGMAIARRSVERRLAAENGEHFPSSLPFFYPRGENCVVDTRPNSPQTGVA